MAAMRMGSCDMYVMPGGSNHEWYLIRYDSHFCDGWNWRSNEGKGIHAAFGRQLDGCILDMVFNLAAVTCIDIAGA